MEFVTLLVLLAGLFAPLLYAVATLLGMKRKSFYPLLRIRKRDGRLSMVKVEP
ncbi:MAG: hypothetical protein AB1411_16790 [Nitrospirota bacterium]